MTSTSPTVSGIHHVTAITADAQANIDFYTGVLGLRLVKLTVNFDDPRSFHLYYGDELGRPGTALTFFEWPGIPRGRVGPPQATATAFAVPAGAIDFWADRFMERRVSAAPSERFGEKLLRTEDPDGMPIEIVGVKEPAGTPWTGGGVSADRAIRGFHSVSLAVEGYESTAETLTGLMGFERAGEDGNRFRYRAAGAGAGGADRASGKPSVGLASIVDILCSPDARRGGMGAGIVHHVAFRASDDAEHQSLRSRIAGAGLNITPVVERNYFRSIYFREPGGVLFEIATDGPGFTIDESRESLGKALMLPRQHEHLRAEIEARWKKLRLPK